MVAILKSDTRPPTVPTAHTRRRPERETFGPRIATVFRTLTGMEPMPWQLDFWDVVGERFTEQECKERMVPYLTPAYREVALGTPRRAAKTTAGWAVLTDQATRRETEPYRTPKGSYSAQTGLDARKKFLRDIAPLFEAETAKPAIRKRVRKVTRAAGGESVIFKNGRGIYLAGTTAESEHGQDYDTAVMDEVFADETNAREAAIGPGTLTLDWAQRLPMSTAGTADSSYWNGKCVAGRKAVEQDSGEGLAYVEFSIPDGASIFDEELWWSYHPALGYSITLAALRYEIHTLAENEELGGVEEATRAYGNRPTTQIFAQHIPGPAWAKVNKGSATAKGKGPHRWTYDVAEDRSWAAIACHNVRTNTTALTDYQPGTDWLKAKIRDRVRRHPGPVSFDGTGPGANLAEEGWHALSSSDMRDAFADFRDTVMADGITIKQDDILDHALSGADVRTSSDRRTWSRRTSKAEISPLVAVTIAAAHTPPERPKPRPIVSTL